MKTITLADLPHETSLWLVALRNGLVLGAVLLLVLSLQVYLAG
jgi:hypothetical protein